MNISTVNQVDKTILYLSAIAGSGKIETKNIDIVFCLFVCLFNLKE